MDLSKAGTGSENIDDEVIEPNRLLTLESISVEDETSALTKVRFGKVTAGTFHAWEEGDSPIAGELTFTNDKHTISEGENFRCIVTGGAANDKVKVYLEGSWQTWRE